MSGRPLSRTRRAFSLIELLVVITIIAILVALLLAAVQRAKTAANKVICANNLYQMVIAAHLHHDALTYFPDGGGDYGPRTDTNGVPNTAPHQEWGFLYQILPYLEHESAWAQTPAAYFQPPEYQCPSRPKRGPSGYGWGVSDYAANGGTQTWYQYGIDGAVRRKGFYVGLDVGYDGVGDDQLGQFDQTAVEAWGPVPPLALGDFSHPSTTILVAEQCTAGAMNGFCWNDEDGGIAAGFCFSTVRFSSAVPHRDTLFNSANPYVDAFGSAHANSFNAAFADGHVDMIRYDVPTATFAAMCSRP